MIDLVVTFFFCFEMERSIVVKHAILHWNFVLKLFWCSSIYGYTSTTIIVHGSPLAPSKQTLWAHKILLAIIGRKVKLIWLSLVNQIVFSINFVIIKIKWIDNIVHWKKCVDKHDIARSLSNFAANNGRNARFKWYFVGHLGCLICHHTFIWKANVWILTFDEG